MKFMAKFTVCETISKIYLSEEVRLHLIQHNLCYMIGRMVGMPQYRIFHVKIKCHGELCHNMSYATTQPWLCNIIYA